MSGSRSIPTLPREAHGGLHTYHTDNLPPGYKLHHCAEDEWFVLLNGDVVTNTISRGYPNEREARSAAWWHYGLG